MELIHYLADYMWQTWAVVAVICLILELMNGDFFIMCFAIGGACAAICAALGAGFYWQMGVFALFTLISLFLVRPFALRYLHKNDDPRPSNADALIGRKGRVVEAIPADGFGRVAIDGDVWKAVSAAGTEIPRGANVSVKSMESITVTVEES